MDQMDCRILHILKDNGRETASDISKKVHLSVSAVLDSNAMGNDVTALMEISREHPRYHDSFTEVIMEHPNILDCYYLTGDYDFVLKISCASSDELERIHRTIKSVPGVSATRTHFVLKEIKNTYSAIPGEAAES